MVVLCIDNDSEDIEFFGDAVKEVDPLITYLSALGGQEALHLLASMQDIQQLPKYIFLDVNMPRMDGKETLIEIRKIDRYRAVQIVMLSTGLSPKEFEEYKQLGANHFMSKGTSLQNLRDKLRAILGNKFS